MKIVTVYPNFREHGGAQEIALKLAKELNSENKIVVLTNSSFIHKDYIKKKVIFEKFSLKNIWKYYKENAFFLSHHRKQTSILVLMNRYLFFNKLKVVHVAHNIFNNYRYFSFFPSTNIAVSNEVRNNLIKYFRIKKNKIHVIFNGLEDSYDYKKEYRRFLKNKVNDIKIILPAMLRPVKQQVDFVRYTKGKINPYVKIYFAGEGPEKEALLKEIGDSTQYKVLGFIDLHKELYNYDYVCLFSKKEGLPLTLIEGCMFAKPLITNNIPSVLDINLNGVNGYVLSNWGNIIECLNKLPFCYEDAYKQMSIKSRKKFLEDFTYNKMVDNYKMIFDNYARS